MQGWCNMQPSFDHISFLLCNHEHWKWNCSVWRPSVRQEFHPTLAANQNVWVSALYFFCESDVSACKAGDAWDRTMVPCQGPFCAWLQSNGHDEIPRCTLAGVGLSSISDLGRKQSLILRDDGPSSIAIHQPGMCRRMTTRGLVGAADHAPIDLPARFPLALLAGSIRVPRGKEDGDGGNVKRGRSKLQQCDSETTSLGPFCDFGPPPAGSLKSFPIQRWINSIPSTS